LKNSDAHLLYKHYEIGSLGFVGSVDTGKMVLKNIAEESRFIPINYELGGKDAAYVREDADIDLAVDNIVDGAMYNSGQSCCSIERVYIHKNHYDKFIDKARDLISKYKLGDPFASDTTLGPMALPDAPILLRDQVAEAVSSGAEIICGGNICQDEKGKGRFFEPTLLKECTNEMSIMSRESFGPLMPCAKVEDDQEALALINNTDYGLTTAIYSKDYKIVEDLSKNIDTGTVYLNRCDYLHPLLPWSGRKRSGCGTSLSKYGFSNFYKLKSLNFKLN